MNDFPHAPSDWEPSDAEDLANEYGISLNDDIWDLISALHWYFKSHDKNDLNRREITDALEEKFHSRGGMKFLYKLLPKGPVSQGCELAGIKIPAGNIDPSFGSVV